VRRRRSRKAVSIRSSTFSVVAVLAKSRIAAGQLPPNFVFGSAFADSVTTPYSRQRMAWIASNASFSALLYPKAGSNRSVRTYTT
jgi:hypothetical protein